MNTSQKRLLIVGMLLAMGAGVTLAWLYGSRIASVSLKNSPFTEAEKVEQHLQKTTSLALDQVIGKHNYFLSIKVNMTNKTTETETTTLTPSIATANQSASSTSQSPYSEPDREAIKKEFQDHQPKPKVAESVPGFPVSYESPQAPNLPTPMVHVQGKNTSSSQSQSVYFNQEKTKELIPDSVKSVTVHVVLDQRQLTLKKINPQTVAVMLTEVAGLDKARGDQLFISSYPFSTAIIGFDESVLRLQDRIKRSGLTPEVLVLFGLGILLLLGLTWAMSRSRRKAAAKALLQAQAQAEALAKQSKDELERERAFQSLCRTLLDVVEKNPSFTASVISEMAATDTSDTTQSLSPMKKILIFVLFLQSENPDIVQRIMQEVGESLSKTLLQGASSFIKVDTGILRSVLQEFYHLLVKKQVIIGGPTISQKILKTAFGADSESVLEATSDFSFLFLDKVTDDRLLHFLSKDSTTFSALVFRFLKEDRVVNLLSQLDPKRAAEISKKMLTLEIPNPNLIQKLSLAVETKLLAPELQTDEHGKWEKMSRVIEKMHTEKRKELLASLAHTDPELSEKLAALVYTFEDLILLSDDDLKSVLFETDIRTIGIALLGLEGPLLNKVKGVLSVRMSQAVEETTALSLSFTDHEIEEARFTILTIARRLSDERRIRFQKGHS